MRLIVCVTCVIAIFLQPAFAFEPFSTVGFVVASGLGYKYFDTIKLSTYCKYRECCNVNVIPHDILSLREKLESKLFGQHIVQEKIFKAVASHYEHIEESRKPLVMTFHGTQGTGKNFVASMIAEAVFEKGTESSHFHLFHGSQYSDVDSVYEQNVEIRKQIEDGIKSCPYSIFVFDEVDKMPKGIFKGISSILDHHTLVRKLDFKKAVFIFLSNYGGEQISKVLYSLVSKEGLFRHDVKLHHLEHLMQQGVFNQEGGLQESELIKSAVIDFYLPFLPLEEKHVIECIKEEYKSCLKMDINPRQEIIDEVLKYIGFNAVSKYAHTGCKTVYAKVQAECY
jgi:ATP-dependent Clp protease ATP-binding subunit ClpA